MDYETFRELFEHVVESVHGSHHITTQAFKPIKLVVTKPQQPKYCPMPKNTKLKSTKEMNYPKVRYSTTLRRTHVNEMNLPQSAPSLTPSAQSN